MSFISSFDRAECERRHNMKLWRPIEPYTFEEKLSKRRNDGRHLLQYNIFNASIGWSDIQFASSLIAVDELCFNTALSSARENFGKMYGDAKNMPKPTNLPLMLKV